MKPSWKAASRSVANVFRKKGKKKIILDKPLSFDRLFRNASIELLNQLMILE